MKKMGVRLTKEYTQIPPVASLPLESAPLDALGEHVFALAALAAGSHAGS